MLLLVRNVELRDNMNECAIFRNYLKLSAEFIMIVVSRQYWIPITAIVEYKLWMASTKGTKSGWCGGVIVMLLFSDYFIEKNYGMGNVAL